MQYEPCIPFGEQNEIHNRQYCHPERGRKRSRKITNSASQWNSYKTMDIHWAIDIDSVQSFFVVSDGNSNGRQDNVCELDN